LTQERKWSDNNINVVVVLKQERKWSDNNINVVVLKQERQWSDNNINVVVVLTGVITGQRKWRRLSDIHLLLIGVACDQTWLFLITCDYDIKFLITQYH